MALFDVPLFYATPQQSRRPSPPIGQIFASTFNAAAARAQDDRQFSERMKLRREEMAGEQHTQSLRDQMMDIQLQEARDAVADRKQVLDWLPKWKADPTLPPPATVTPQAQGMVNQIMLSKSQADLSNRVMQDNKEFADVLLRMMPADRRRTQELMKEKGGATGEVWDFALSRPLVPKDADSQQAMTAFHAKMLAAEAEKAGDTESAQFYSGMAGAMDKVMRGGRLDTNELLSNELVRSAVSALPYADPGMIQVGPTGVKVELDLLQKAQRAKLEAQGMTATERVANSITAKRLEADELEAAGMVDEAGHLRTTADLLETMSKRGAAAGDPSMRAMINIGTRLVERGAGQYSDFFNADGTPNTAAISRASTSTAKPMNIYQVNKIMERLHRQIEDHVDVDDSLPIAEKDAKIARLDEAAMQLIEKRGPSAATITIADILAAEPKPLDLNANGALPADFQERFLEGLRNWNPTNAVP